MEKTLTQELLEEAQKLLNLDGTELAYRLCIKTWEMPNYRNGTKELPMVAISKIAGELGIKIEKFYGKIFDTKSPDIDLLEVMKQSMKEKPFVVYVPKEIDKNFLDIVAKTTNDMALKALEDEDCNAVFIAYVKA